MTCRDLVDFLDDYIEGCLTEAERGVFDSHLSECSWCREYLKQYRATVHLAKDSLDSDVAREVPEELIQAILAAKDQSG